MDRTKDAKPAKYGQRGEHRIGQYYHAFPAHAVKLDDPLDERVRSAWLRLAEEMSVKTAELEQAKSRGDFIRAAWKSQTAIAEKK